uniref:Uncharacterized protein n=1 Tax=Eptatretus burgeri TaxID=7764 RepID=A0A8C4WZ47_EPTBU
MTDMVLKGIQEAEEELQKSNQKKLQQEGILRQLPIVSSMLNWFSPVQVSPHGQTFNLIAGSLASTENTYQCMSQDPQKTPPPSPTVQFQHPGIHSKTSFLPSFSAHLSHESCPSLNPSS